MTSSNGNIFRVTGHLCGEFTGPRWIPYSKASDGEFSLISVWINNREAGDLSRYHAHYDVTVMTQDWFENDHTYICSALIKRYALYITPLDMWWV